MSLFSLNQVRVRDVVVGNTFAFEIDRLERIEFGMKEAEYGPVTRIECLSEEDKDDWVTAVNTEVKDLIFFGKRLSGEFSDSKVSLITI